MPRGSLPAQPMRVGHRMCPRAAVDPSQAAGPCCQCAGAQAGTRAERRHSPLRPPAFKVRTEADLRSPLTGSRLGHQTGRFEVYRAGAARCARRHGQVSHCGCHIAAIAPFGSVTRATRATVIEGAPSAKRHPRSAGPARRALGTRDCDARQATAVFAAEPRASSCASTSSICMTSAYLWCRSKRLTL